MYCCGWGLCWYWCCFRMGIGGWWWSLCVWLVLDIWFRCSLVWWLILVGVCECVCGWGSGLFVLVVGCCGIVFCCLWLFVWWCLGNGWLGWLIGWFCVCCCVCVCWCWCWLLFLVCFVVLGGRFVGFFGWSRCGCGWCICVVVLGCCWFVCWRGNFFWVGFGSVGILILRSCWLVCVSYLDCVVGCFIIIGWCLLWLWLG